MRRVRLLVTFAVLLSGTQILWAGGAGAAGQGWTELYPSVSPPARAGAAMAYDPISNLVVLFGGYDATGYRSDTWTFDGTRWRRSGTNASRTPSPRAAAGMAFDSVTNELVLFGGYDGSSFLGDTWTWDGSTRTWTQQHPTTGPHGLTGPLVFSDPANGRLDLFGGFDGQFYNGTTWQWNGTRWVNLHTAATPGARAASVYAEDPANHSAVVFGGLADVNPINTWTFDGHDWTQQDPSTQPPQRFETAAAYDGTHRGVVTFGGASPNGDLHDTWGWDGSNWRRLGETPHPSARGSQSMAWDPAIGHVVLFGGDSKDGILGDTWLL